MEIKADKAGKHNTIRYLHVMCVAEMLKAVHCNDYKCSKYSIP